jgi:hypothetical protein
MECDKNEFPWERQPGEPIKWYRSFEIFRLLGPERSVLSAYNTCQEEKFRRRNLNSPDKSRQVEWKVKKYNSKTWTNQARLWNWKKRAEAWDTEIMQANNAKREKEIQNSLYSGLALADQRVNYLKEIANKLMSDFRDEGKIWVVEERTIGKGEKSSLTAIKKFNDKLVRELRETLEDIALEKGARTKNIDLKTDGHGLSTGQVHIYIPDNGRDNLETVQG